MLNFNSLSSRLHYFREKVFANRITVKIDRFDITKNKTHILVIYRLGRQKLNQKLIIADFAVKYYENLSGYDRQRITKFSLLQELLTNLFPTQDASRKHLVNYIKKAVSNDKLF